MKPFILALAALLFTTAVRSDPAPDQPVPETLDLKTAIQFAVQNNFTIREAKERIRQQQGILLTVKASSIPTVAAQGLYQENSDAISQTVPASSNFWQFSIGATQALYAGGGIHSAIKSARLNREAAILDFKGVLNQSLLDVRTKFYAVLLARGKIEVQTENLGLLESQLKEADNRFQAGTTSSFDKLRANVALANGRVPLITARNDFRIAVEQLRQALGFTNHSSPDLQKMPQFIGELTQPPVSFDLQSCLDSAHANRPELLRLAKIRDASDEGIVQARSTYYPNLSVNGGWEAEKSPFTTGPGASESVSGWRLALQSQWNIFDGRATEGRVLQAKSVLEQSKLALDDQTLFIDVAVRQAHSSWQEASELAEATQKTVEQAEESLRLATAKYDAGTATHLDVLQAQVDLTQARTNLLEANYTYAVAVAQLRQASGIADEFVSN